MGLDHFMFWIVAVTGGVLAGWWMAVRPGASFRGIATPVSALVLIMAVLLCLLSFTGQNASRSVRAVHHAGTAH